MQEATSRWAVCYAAEEELAAQTDGDCECIICLGDLEPHEELVRLPCTDHGHGHGHGDAAKAEAKAHIFHKECLSRWLLCSAACPTCRRGVRPMLKKGR